MQIYLVQTQLHFTGKTSDVFRLMTVAVGWNVTCSTCEIKLCLDWVYLYFLLHHFHYIPDIPVCDVSSFLLVCSSIMDFCVWCIVFCLLCECHQLSYILCTCENMLNQHESLASAAGHKSYSVSVSHKYSYDRCSVIIRLIFVLHQLLIDTGIYACLLNWKWICMAIQIWFCTRTY